MCSTKKKNNAIFKSFLFCSVQIILFIEIKKRNLKKNTQTVAFIWITNLERSKCSSKRKRSQRGRALYGIQSTVQCICWHSVGSTSNQLKFHIQTDSDIDACCKLAFGWVEAMNIHRIFEQTNSFCCLFVFCILFCNIVDL